MTGIMCVCVCVLIVMTERTSNYSVTSRENGETKDVSHPIILSNVFFFLQLDTDL